MELAIIGAGQVGGAQARGWARAGHRIRLGLPLRPVLPMAGDDPAAEAVVARLLEDLGLEPRDAGPLSRARLLEPLAMLGIEPALVHGAGRQWAFAMSRRAGS